MDHPCILRRFDVYHEKSDLFVEMEYAAGGSLLDRIYKLYIMTEDECKFIFYQIACALAYLHRLKIVKYFCLTFGFLKMFILGSSRYKTSKCSPHVK